MSDVWALQAEFRVKPQRGLSGRNEFENIPLQRRATIPLIRKSRSSADAGASSGEGSPGSEPAVSMFKVSSTVSVSKEARVGTQGGEKTGSAAAFPVQPEDGSGSPRLPLIVSVSPAQSRGRRPASPPPGEDHRASARRRFVGL